MNASSLLRLCAILPSTAVIAATALLGCSDDPIQINSGENGDNDVLVINQSENNQGDQNSSSNQNSGEEDPNQNQNSNQQPHGAHTQTLLDDTFALSGGYTDTIEIEVPEDVLSMAISVTEGPPATYYLVTDWSGPNDFQLVPNGWESGEIVCYQNCNNRIMASPGAFGGLAPNNPSSEVNPGTHTFRVGSVNPMGGLNEPSTASSHNLVRVTVHAEMVTEEVPQTGTLDLNLFFTGAHGWTAESAPNDDSVQNAIDTMDTIYDQVGIDIGEVSYHDVDSQYQVIEDLQSGTGDLAEMFAHSENATLDGPSVFFVSELRSSGMFITEPGGFGNQQGGGAVLGISGGIPGPMIVNGSPRSGVAIATDSSSSFGAPGIAHVTAHEVGHYLGLFHTTEQMGGFFGPSHDPLPDTPEDDPSYLMYYSGQGDKMSEWQGRVMRKNPWVYFD